jgi:hypothetical protein
VNILIDDTLNADYYLVIWDGYDKESKLELVRYDEV